MDNPTQLPDGDRSEAKGASARTQATLKSLFSGDAENSLQFAGPMLVRSVSLTGLFLLAVLYTMYFAAPILIPVTLALVLGMLLSNPVRLLKKLRIPAPIGAAIVMLGLLSVIATGGYLLAEPTSDWLSRAPEALYKLERELRPVRESVEAIKETGERVTEVTNAVKNPGVTEVKVRSETFSDLLLSGTPRALAGLLVLTVVLYFWLAGGDGFLRKLVRIIPRLEDKKVAVETFRTMQQQISRYLGTITFINIGLGAATSLAMWFLGVPDPPLWGVMVALFNFAPYVGPLASLALLTLVGLVTFDATAQALLVPGAFLVLTTLEGQFVTPMLVGRSLELSTLAVFVALLLFGWLWGVIGALMAVPILTIIKVVSERVPPLASLSYLLARGEP